MGYTFPFYPPNSPKNEYFKNMKKTHGDIIILHMCTKNHDHMLYCLRDRLLFIILVIFLPFYPLNSPKNENLKEMKKKKEKKTDDNIILHTHTKNHDHMLYCSWDMVHDECNCYFSFWAIFCPFTSPRPPLVTAQKIKISKKWKKCLEISSFYTRVLKIMIKRCSFLQYGAPRNGQMEKVT